MSDTEVSEDVADLIDQCRRNDNALRLACQNLAELGSQRARLMAALVSAHVLLDHLLTEMRTADITPSAGVIVHKAEFDRAMRELLGRS
jgi:hypothetical protein